MTNIRRALWLGLLLVCLTAVSWAQLPVADDSYITSTNPTTNSGNSPSLVLQQATNGITLIKIDISPLQAAGVTSSAIDKAYLKLYTSAVTGQGTFDLYQITSSWAEGTVTYNTKPTMTLITSGTTCPSGVQCVNTASKYVQIDITSLVQGWLANPPVSNFGLALKPNSTTISVTFESKESTTTSHAPELDIVYNNSLAQIPGQIGPGQVGPGTYSINISGTAANATLAAGLSGQIQLCQNGQVAIGITSAGNAVCLVGPLSIANGGTGATTGAAALASLGGVSQTYVDAHDTAEATARAAADATLQSNINAETARAQSAEGTLTTNLNGEISRAQNAEATKADLIKPVQVNNSAAGNGACSLVNALVLNPTQPSGQQLFVCRDIGGGTLQWQLINDDFATTSSANSYTDQQVAIEKSRATTAEAGLQSSINAETSRAQGAETTLQTNINGEAAARAAQDIALGASIASETTRATGAESTLQTNINNVNAASAKLNGTNQFTGGSQKLAPSAAGYASLNVASSNTPPSSPAIGDLWLLSNDPHLNFRATNAASELLAFISDINTANGTTLAAASQYTDAQVAAEKARAMAAESALTTNLNNEITRATSAETAETSARQAADSAEAGARIAADSALSASILAETSRATSSENILTTGLNNEISRAQAAEATKADLVTPVKLDNTAVLHNTCATVNALVLNNNQPSGQQLFICRSVNNVLQWELINDDASTVQTATAAANAYTDQQVAAEASARQAADNTLQSNINAEASARQTADSAEATARAAADAAEIVARQAGDAATLAAANTYTDSAKTNILTQPQTFSGNETFSGNNSFSGTNSFTGKVDMTGAPTFPVQTTSTTPPSSGQPNACASGQLLLQVNGQPGQQLFVCNAAHDGWAMINDDAASINSAVTTANAYTDSKVLAEQNRATTTETGLQSSINAESSRAQGAEATLQGNINAEAGARMAQDVILGAAIATEATRATASESTLTTNLNNEISRAQAAEATKADLIAPVQLDNTAVLHNTCGTVNALVLNNTQPSGQQLFICRTVNNVLQWELINDDAATTSAANTYTDQQVAAEAAARQAADASEATARQQGDANTLSAADAHADAGDVTTLSSANAFASNAVAAEAVLRATADASTLASANSYTNGQISSVNTSLAGKANLAGGNNFTGDQSINGNVGITGDGTVKGLLNLPAAVAGANQPSNALRFDSTDNSNASQSAQLLTLADGSLSFQFGPTGGPISSKLNVAPTGIITFASGQTFPGTQNLTPGTGISFVGNAINNAGALSFNGRNGAVTPASGDYSFTQISGTITPAQVGAGTYLINISGNAGTATNAANASLLANLPAAFGVTVNTIAARDANADLFANVFHGSGASLTNIPSGALPGNVVYNDQANIYTAGSKQTFKASATLAGLNVFGVATDPTGPLVGGDLWFNTTGGHLKFFDGAATKSLAFTTDLTGGTVTSIATGTGLTGGPITTSGTISLSAATSGTLGGVIAPSCVAGSHYSGISGGTLQCTADATTTSLGFSAITGGNNTNALLIGTGGSLNVTGTGTINATSLSGELAAASATAGTIAARDASGNLSAVQFNGSGAGLTNVPTSSLAGAPIRVTASATSAANPSAGVSATAVASCSAGRVLLGGGAQVTNTQSPDMTTMSQSFPSSTSPGQWTAVGVVIKNMNGANTMTVTSYALCSGT